MPPCGGCQARAAAAAGKVAAAAKIASSDAPHAFVDDSGASTTFDSQVQAMAAQVKAGGGGTVEPR